MAETDSLGYWIRRKRMALDLTQRELADQIPCSLATIKKIETDARHPSQQMAERLAICLSLPAGERALFVAVAQGRRPVSFLTLSETPVTQHPPFDRLPPTGTPFIGREAELAALTALLASPDARLLTILGPGGMGKTRLALAAARAEQERLPRAFGDGVVFVDLAPVASPDLIVSAIAAALDLDLAERRGDSRSLGQKLVDFLRPRRLLLILDNFEHLLPAGSAPLIPAMLGAAPGLKVLATSRVRLNLREEHLYPLSGMSYAAHSAHAHAAVEPDYAAAQLFLTAARRLRPGFRLLPGEAAVLAGICRQLEGMPLALELAASWVDALSLGGIAEELDAGIDLLTSDLSDLPERQRSIRSTLDGSWRLLEPTERQEFMCLSVFRGGFTRDAAAQVAGAALSTLARLISKSLLVFDPSTERYQIHEVLRQYGQEKLVQAGALQDTLRRHLHYFLSLAEMATDNLFGPAQIAWLDRLDEERDNFRSALTWALAQPELVSGAADLVIALSWYWRIRSHVLEGRVWLDRMVLHAGLADAQRASLLYHAGHLAWMQDDFELARSREEESLALWRSLGSAGRRGAAYALHTLGMAHYGTEYHIGSDLPLAVAAFEDSLALFREVGDPWGMAFSLSWIAYCRTAQGRTADALAAAQESVAIYQQLGEVWGLGMVIGALANLSLQASDLPAARDYAETAQALRAQVGHRHSMAVGYELLAAVAEAENKPGDAASAYREAIAILESLGNRPYADELRNRLAALAAGLQTS